MTRKEKRLLREEVSRKEINALIKLLDSVAEGAWVAGTDVAVVSATAKRLRKLLR